MVPQPVRRNSTNQRARPGRISHHPRDAYFVCSWSSRRLTLSMRAENVATRAQLARRTRDRRPLVVACARSSLYRTLAGTAMHREHHVRHPAHTASIARVVATRLNSLKTVP
jgi:hypothetical protein